MIPLTLHLDVEQSPLPQDGLIADGTLTDIGLLRNGTHRGKAIVGLVVTMPDGSRVIGQTTWALLRTAFRGLAASPIVASVLVEEVGEVARECIDLAALRKELIQVAAMAGAWADAIGAAPAEGSTP